MKKATKVEIIAGIILFLALIFVVTNPVTGAPMSANELNAAIDQLDEEKSTEAAKRFHVSYRNHPLSRKISIVGGPITQARNGRIVREWVPFEAKERIHYPSAKKTWLYHVNKRLPF